MFMFGFAFLLFGCFGYVLVYVCSNYFKLSFVFVCRVVGLAVCSL